MSDNTKTLNSTRSQSQSNQPTTKVIEVGKFYLLYEGSKKGHPGYIIWKDDNHNLYLAIKFGSTPKKNNRLLNFILGKGVKHSFVYKRLFLGKRKDFGKNELLDMHLNNNQIKQLKKGFSLSNPTFSKNINSKDKHYYKRGMKKPLLQGQLSDPKGPTDKNTIQKEFAGVKK